MMREPNRIKHRVMTLIVLRFIFVFSGLQSFRGRADFALVLRGVRYGVVTVLAWSLIGCDPGDPAGNATGPRPRIAFIGASLDDPLWPALKLGAERSADRLGLVDVDYAAPAVRSSDAQQALILERIDAGAQGVCVQVIDPTALSPWLATLRPRGIRVVTMMRDVAPFDRVGHAGVDDEAVGRLLARAVVETLPERGRVMLLHAGRLDPVYGPRLRAYDASMERFPQVHTQARFDCQADPVRAERIVAERLTRFRPDAWVAVGPWPLDAMRADRMDLPDGCTVIACGAFPAYWPLLRDGRCAALIGAEDYSTIGREALTICIAAILNEQHKAQTYLASARIIRAADLDTYRRTWLAVPKSQPR